MTYSGPIPDHREGFETPGTDQVDNERAVSIFTQTAVYGDLRPVKNFSKIASVLIASLGLMMSGIVVAVIVHAVSMALDESR